LGRKQRNSSFELLRIFLMFLIIFSHFSGHSGAILNTNSLNLAISYILHIGGKIAVDCFIILSGFYLINSKFNFKKILKLYIQVLSYSVIIGLIFSVMGIEKFSWYDFFPIIYSSGKYWFFAAYFLLYLFSPFLNQLINKISKAEYTKLLCTLFVFASVIPFFTNQILLSNDFLWFTYLYLIGAFIKKYDIRIFDSKKKYFFALVILYLLIIVIDVILYKCGIIYIYNIPHYISILNSPILLVGAILIFFFFKEMNIKNNNAINFISSLVFGIYLFHDNYLIRNIIWSDIFKVRTYFFSSPMLYLYYALKCTIIIFFIGTIIELIRKKIFEDFFFKKITTIIDKIKIGGLKNGKN